ncbi:hypothetical protein ABFS83_04G222500 [Erythranthe nasuta]
MSGQEQVRIYTRARRRQMLDVDLNTVPPSQDSQAFQQGGATAMPPPIDVEALDDDVIISSPRAFAEAKNNARRNLDRPIVVDVDSVVTDERLSRKRRRAPSNQTIINCDLYINLEGSSNNSTRKSGQSAVVAPPPPPPPPKEPVFSCAVCMGPLVEETSTKCGHIFCKGCIKAAIAAQSKCPTCRRKTTVKDLIRVYLPSCA